MHGNHCDLFCSCVESCAFVGSWIWIESQFATSLLHFILSETLSFDRTHTTCQDVRHASWGVSEFDLCRKCEASVKV